MVLHPAPRLQKLSDIARRLQQLFPVESTLPAHRPSPDYKLVTTLALFPPMLHHRREGAWITNKRPPSTISLFYIF
jgi:hypothetical protein